MRQQLTSFIAELERKKIVSTEVIGETKADQTPRRNDINICPSGSNDGEILGFDAMVEDVTQRRRGENALRESQQHLAAFFDDAPVMMGVNEIPADFSDVYHIMDNRAAEHFLGVQPGQTSGKWTIADLGSTSEAVALIEPHYRRAVETREVTTFRLHVETDTSGNESVSDLDTLQPKILDHATRRPVIWLQVHVSYLGQGEKDRHRFCWVAIDVTEQRDYERKLDAERQSAEEARRQAEAANAARGEFLANMSHEIRTPMSAILGYADMLADHLQDPDNRQCVETIQRNGKFLLDIINDILDLSKIDAGKLTIQPIGTRPEAVLADIVSLMNVRAELQGIKLQAKFGGKIPEQIHVDVKRLKQVLLNLTGNAIKFTEHGEVNIVCRYDSGNQKDGRPSLVFDIVDTGVGIPPDRLSSLFEPFTQMDQSNTRAFGGSGLGLAISRRLANLLGGAIEAESAPEKGSRFTLRIDPGPVANVSLVQPSLVATTPDSKSNNETFAGHCLIVDDRRDIRYLAQHFIEQAGVTVTTANNGQQGIETLEALRSENNDPHIILMDMQMPVMDGYAAVAEIRRRGIDITIIALTANAMAEDRDKCLAAGCTDFMTKPLDRSMLFEKLAKHSSR